MDFGDGGYDANRKSSDKCEGDRSIVRCAHQLGATTTRKEASASGEEHARVDFGSLGTDFWRLEHGGKGTVGGELILGDLEIDFEVLKTNFGRNSHVF